MLCNVLFTINRSKVQRLASQSELSTFKAHRVPLIVLSIKKDPRLRHKKCGHVISSSFSCVVQERTPSRVFSVNSFQSFSLTTENGSQRLTKATNVISANHELSEPLSAQKAKQTTTVVHPTSGNEV